MIMKITLIKFVFVNYSFRKNVLIVLAHFNYNITNYVDMT